MGLLEINNLTVEFGREEAPFRAVDQVSLSLDSGDVVGVVGESGSGKSVTVKALMGLIDWPGRVRADRLAFSDQDLLRMPDKQRRKITGHQMAMIFQDPMTSLNPCFTAGFQVSEALRIHEEGRRADRRARTLELLEQVGIPDPKARLNAFPHQLSGGMSQRVMIAMAIACNPKLLIADEPTTALDVTIQAQIMELLLSLQRQRRMALLLITHDLALVAEAAQRVVVMYAGQIVETGPVPEIFDHPRHPYTAALLEALPERSLGHARLQTIPGVVPGQFDRPSGCLLNPRCKFANERCRLEAPQLTPLSTGRLVRCHTPLDDEGKPQG
ncbi:MAG: dipeptide ABC transporter ATP-binding protein [Desulfuromonadales bacterium]